MSGCQIGDFPSLPTSPIIYKLYYFYREIPPPTTWLPSGTIYIGKSTVLLKSVSGSWMCSLVTCQGLPACG